MKSGPRVQVELFMNRTYPIRTQYIELSTWQVRRLNNSNTYFNFTRFSRSFRLARPGISPLERLWSGFHSESRTFHVPNLMHKLLNRVLYTVVLPFAELPSSAVIKIGAWINSADLNNLGRPYFELALAHEKFGVKWWRQDFLHFICNIKAGDDA